MPDQAAALPLASDEPSPLKRGWLWILNYILKPIGQILLFIVAGSVFMSILAVLTALIFRYPKPNIDLLRIVGLQLPDMIVDGVTIGFLYAMIALGYTMVYGVLRFINFGHSEIFMFGGFIGYEVLAWLQGNKQIASIPVLVLVPGVIVVAGLASGMVAVGVERVAYRPLRNAPRLVPLISAIGVAFLLQDAVRIFLDATHQSFIMSYPTIPGLSGKLSVPFTNGVTISGSSVVVIISAVITMIGLNYFVNATRRGKAIRAVSQDQPTSSLMGIDVNRMISLTFFIGGSLGGAAGVLWGLKTGVITPYVGFIPGLKAFTAAVLGGIGSITGALLGGILLGLIESFFSAILPYFPALGGGYRDVFVFAVLILILIFRPTGLLGEKDVEKV